MNGILFIHQSKDIPGLAKFLTTFDTPHSVDLDSAKVREKIEFKPNIRSMCKNLTQIIHHCYMVYTNDDFVIANKDYVMFGFNGFVVFYAANHQITPPSIYKDIFANAVASFKDSDRYIEFTVYGDGVDYPERKYTLKHTNKLHANLVCSTLDDLGYFTCDKPNLFVRSGNLYEMLAIIEPLREEVTFNNKYTYFSDLKEMKGARIKDIRGLEKESPEVVIELLHPTVKEIVFHHEQDCCESVFLEDFEISSKSIIGGIIIDAREESSSIVEPGSSDITWTFYHIDTDKGSLFLRWCGESNTFYSTAVDVKLINHEVNDVNRDINCY